jgi:hypothetical protein
MQNASVPIIVAIVLIAVALVVWQIVRQRRHQRLKGQFGPEYERTIQKLGGDRAKAENELEKRRKVVEALELRPLSEDERRHFSDRWQTIQKAFVDAPDKAVADAQTLVNEVIAARGDRATDPAEHRAHLSAEMPDVVDDYRQALAVAERNRRGEASTEDMRQALVHYRALFDSLLRAGSVEPERERRRRA